MKIKKTVVQSWLSLLLVVLLFSVVGCNFSLDDPLGENQASTFSLKLLDGSEFKLEDYQGKPVVINFWATWCPPCRQEIPALAASYEKYKNAVQFIAIAVSSDNENDVRTFVANHAISFPVGIDTSGEISKDYEVTGIPTTFFINKDSQISDSHTGAMDEGQFSAKIEELLNE